MLETEPTMKKEVFLSIQNCPPYVVIGYCLPNSLLPQRQSLFGQDMTAAVNKEQVGQ